jgi:hypothetical protein
MSYYWNYSYYDRRLDTRRRWFGGWAGAWADPA